jgi:hypothetical protein
VNPNHREDIDRRRKLRVGNRISPAGRDIFDLEKEKARSDLVNAVCSTV